MASRTHRDGDDEHAEPHDRVPVRLHPRRARGAGLGQRLTFEQLQQRATWRNLHPEFQRRAAAMMAAAAERVPLGVGTGWRSFAEQQAGFERDPKEPFPDAPPRPPAVERFTIPTGKTLLHPDQRAELHGNRDVKLLPMLALGRHASAGDPVLDIGAVDGDYGPRTQAAVRRLQRLHRLDDDGVVGRRSWAAFLEAD